MTYIDRTITAHVTQRLRPGRAVLIYGSRRVGKTMLLRSITGSYPGRVLSLNGEDRDVQDMLANESVASYRRLLSGTDLLAIDEAQAIPGIGRKLKLIVDEMDGLSVLASGSSSFDIRNQTGEPLVGRATTFLLLPFSQGELSTTESPLDTRRELETRLIYGSYPDVTMMDDNKLRAEYLREMVDAYLLKDIFALDGLKNATKINKLLQLVAFQAGSEVSYDELATGVGMSRNTVEKYLDLLAKVYVIFRIGGFARNLRKELSKAGKWYFYDNGVRNAVIGNFAPLAIRQDTGALWESYIISERIKRANNARLGHSFHFWKTYDRQEIDLVETDLEGGIEAMEVKWGDRNPRCPVAFAGAYPEASFGVINRDNYLDFIL